MAPESPKTPEIAIQEGRDHYAAKRFRAALESFTRAMKLCPCARGLKRKRCSCKDFERVASEGGSIFNEAMNTCSCSVGKTFNKCDNELHVQALDYRAATFEAMKEFERAQRDAEWILELAPRLPDGYLRLGKVARLQKKNEFAWRVYNAGIETGNDNRLAGSRKLQKLYAARQPLQVRFCRRDPLKNPSEIVHRILSYLNLADFVQCLAVSKEWRRYLTSPGNERIWRHLLFTKIIPHRCAPSAGFLRKLVSYSGNDVRSIVIENVQRFRLTTSKFNALMHGSRNLEYLCLKGRTHEDIEVTQRTDILKCLKRVLIDEFAFRRPEFFRFLMLNSAETLEDLHIRGLPLDDEHVELPLLPRLKYFRLEGLERYETPSLSINRLARQTPALEQIWLRDVTLMASGADVDESTTWTKLKAVIVSGSDSANPISVEMVQWMTSLRQGTDLKHLDFDFRWKNEGQGPLGMQMISNVLNQNPAPTSTTSFQQSSFVNLRSLRLSRAFVSPSMIHSCVAPSVTAGKLHTFDLVFPLDRFGAPEGTVSREHLWFHEWLQGAASIKCLGIFNFRFRKYPRDDSDLPLPAFLASFPNLETLEINSEHYEEDEFCSVLEAIVRVTRLKRLYQTTVKGAMLDRLRALTAKEGIEMIWGERPKEWPVPIEEDV